MARSKCKPVGLSTAIDTRSRSLLVSSFIPFSMSDPSKKLHFVHGLQFLSVEVKLEQKLVSTLAEVVALEVVSRASCGANGLGSLQGELVEEQLFSGKFQQNECQQRLAESLLCSEYNIQFNRFPMRTGKFLIVYLLVKPPLKCSSIFDVYFRFFVIQICQIIVFSVRLLSWVLLAL